MKIDEQELSRELEFMNESGGASSYEEFWMFTFLKMVLIIFVLMGYITYLQKLDVDTVKKYIKSNGAPQQREKSTEIAEDIIDIYLREEQGGIYLTMGKDMDAKFNYDQLAEALSMRLGSLKGDTVIFNIYSPGKYYYKDVMDVCFIIDNPSVMGKSGVKRKLNLIYEEEEVEE